MHFGSCRAQRGWTRGASSNARGRACSPISDFGVKISVSASKISIPSSKNKKVGPEIADLPPKTAKLDLKSPFFRQKRRSRTWNRRFWSKNGKVGSEIADFPPKTPILDLESPFFVRKRRSWTQKRQFWT
jgi:hypothetical protein